MELTTAWNGTLDLGVVVVSPLPTDVHFCWQNLISSSSTPIQHTCIIFPLFSIIEGLEELEANSWGYDVQ